MCGKKIELIQYFVWIDSCYCNDFGENYKRIRNLKKTKQKMKNITPKMSFNKIEF